MIRSRIRVALAVAGAALAAAAAPAPAASVRIYLVRGDQLAPVARTVPTGTTPGMAALQALAAGPTAAERAQGYRTALPRSVTLLGYLRGADGIAIGDFDARLNARASLATRSARLAQVVYTATGVRGVRRFRLWIGGSPVSRFAGRPLAAALGRGDLDATRLPRPPVETLPPRNADTLALQRRLAALGYLPSAARDGRFGERTRQAVIAFQIIEGLAVDGIAGRATRGRLDTAARPVVSSVPVAGRRVEVDTARQLLFLVGADDVVQRTIHVSTGVAAMPTPAGQFVVFGHERLVWSVPFQRWLEYTSTFAPGTSLQAAASVPVGASSRGSVLVPYQEAAAVYAFATPGTSIVVR